MSKALFTAGLIAVLVNVLWGVAQGTSLAAFGCGLMFAVFFVWLNNWMEL